MWEHGGVCQCGKRTYVFGQCTRCIREEAQDALKSALEAVSDEALDARDLGPEAVVQAVCPDADLLSDACRRLVNQTGACSGDAYFLSGNDVAAMAGSASANAWQSFRCLLYTSPSPRD